MDGFLCSRSKGHVYTLHHDWCVLGGLHAQLHQMTTMSICVAEFGDAGLGHERLLDGYCYSSRTLPGMLRRLPSVEHARAEVDPIVL